MDEALTNKEFTRPADKLIGICRNHLAKLGNKSPTSKELLDMAKKVLEARL